MQKIKLPDDSPSWIVIDDRYLPVKPVSEYLKYLVINTGKTPCTIRSYANHLKLFWNYLAASNTQWKAIKLNELASFVGWLRTPSKNLNVISFSNVAVRKATTINAILGCLSSFYFQTSSIKISWLLQIPTVTGTFLVLMIAGKWSARNQPTI